MKIGVCVAPEQWQIAAGAADYIELPFCTVAAMENGAFEALALAIEKAGACVAAMNLFLPSTLRLTGPDADMEGALAFVATGMERARRLGARVVAFGSSGARNVPEGFSPDRAWQQVIGFLRAAGPIAKRNGIVLAMEPLRRQECNLVVTVEEACRIEQQAGAPGTAVMADYYHIAENKEGFGGIALAGCRLSHAHIADPNGRRVPLPEYGHDYTGFFAALAGIGYTGRLSIEGGSADLAVQLPPAVAYLKDLAAQAGL
nr:sugar phosphate isomerase/epimerase [bacterium]